MPIIPESASGVPTSPPISPKLKPKPITPTTISEIEMILLIIFVYSLNNYFGDILY